MKTRTARCGRSSWTIPADSIPSSRFTRSAERGRQRARPPARLELNQLGQIVVTSEQHTNVPGVYAAGDATNLHDHQISAAVHEATRRLRR